MPINHAFVSGKSAAADATVVDGVDWDAAHTLPWTKVIDQSGTSFASWTSITGTWTSDGTNIKQSSTAASFARAYYTTKMRLFPCIVQYDFRFDSGGSGDDYAGISFGSTSTAGGAAVRPEIVSGVSQLRIEADDGAGQTDLYSASSGVPTWTRGTWYTLKVLCTGFTTTIWVNGTLIGTNRVLLPASRVYDYFRLLTHSAAVDFRNISLYTLDLPI